MLSSVDLITTQKSDLGSTKELQNQHLNLQESDSTQAEIKSPSRTLTKTVVSWDSEEERYVKMMQIGLESIDLYV